ncbi:MAG TPA: hypothetical protein VF462_13985 [Micromonosporaceae bacterium]
MTSVAAPPVTDRPGTPTPPAPATGCVRGQLGPAARLIWLVEKAHWVRDVRWPNQDRLAAKRVRG